MYLYNKSMCDQFKWKFPGIENIETSYSQLLQDMFVLAAFNGKKNGTFLEIGAYHPTFISNTFLLESQFGWNGVSIDLDSSATIMFKNSDRTAKFYQANALELDYLELIDRNYKTRYVDYLQVDIEPNTNTLACLKRIPFDKVGFGIIHFETDWYDPASTLESNDYVRRESRAIIRDYGYELVAGNLSNLDYLHPMEDWHMSKEIFSVSQIEKFKRNSDEPIPANVYMGV